LVEVHASQQNINEQKPTLKDDNSLQLNLYIILICANIA